MDSMSETKRPAKTASRRVFLALLAGGAYLLLDSIYGGPLSLLVRSLYKGPQIERLTGRTIKAAPIAALYSDEATWSESVRAATRMLEWVGYAVELVGADEINTRGLDRFNLLCVPGGNMYQYARDIFTTGKEKIRNFIRNGGGYIGLCAGAYFASETVIWEGDRLPMTPLGIFPGAAEGPLNEIAPYPDYAMCKVNIVDLGHPITRAGPDSVWMLYYWGPALKPNWGAKVSVLGTYDENDLPAMLGFDYGLGRLFLVGTHPEIEEDSDRDGVAFGDEWDDQGSDWELMEKAASWCLR